jgi:mycothiol synthase
MELRPATWDDLGAIRDLLSARGRAARGSSEETVELIRAEWELPSFDVGRDNWVATQSGRLVGYAALNPAQELAHAAPDETVGHALLDRVEARARERGFDAVRVRVSPEDEALSALIRCRGFELETETLRMWKRLDGDDPAPAWPRGIAVATYEPGDAESLHRLLDDVYLAWDAGYVPLAHEDWERWLTADDEFDPKVWWLARSNGQLVGCALHWRTGWLKDLVVRADYRGRGLGTALLRHGFAEFARRGVDRMGLKVDAANPTGAARLYERLGFVADRRDGIWVRFL